MHTYGVYEYSWDEGGAYENHWEIRAADETAAKRKATATALIGNCLYLCKGERVLAKKSYGRWYKK